LWYTMADTVRADGEICIDILRDEY
jgi:hypothetical protein